MQAADFFAANPYLFTGLFGLATVALAWLVAGAQRRMMLLAGIVTLPFFPFAALFNHEYWWPTRLGGGRFGIEDAIYTFVLGASAWFFASVLFRDRYAAEGGAALFMRRTIAVTVVAFAAFGLLFALGVGATLPSMLVPTAITAWVLSQKPALWRLSLCGAIGCCALYYAELLLWFAIWPQMRNWWTPGTPWSRSFLGEPIGDVVWSALVGAAHPAILGYLCNVCRISPDVRR